MVFEKIHAVPHAVEVHGLMCNTLDRRNITICSKPKDYIT